MSIDMSQFYQVFFEESEELLAEAEKLLLNLDVENPEPEHLNAIFRAAHSIKGGAATFSMLDMTEITHVLESLLDKIRKSEMALTIDHVDAFLSAKDVLLMQLEGHRSGSAVDADVVEQVKIKLKTFAESSDTLTTVAEIDVAAVNASSKQTVSAVNKADVIDNPESANEAIPVFGHANSPHETAKTQAVFATQAGAQQAGFEIAIGSLSAKDADNLKSELSLLGDVEMKAHGQGYVFCVKGDTNVTDIIAVSSFIVDINASDIHPLSASGAKARETQVLRIHAPVFAAKVLQDLEAELALLGTLSKTVSADGSAAYLLSTDASIQTVLSVCSFVVEPELLNICVDDTHNTQAAAGQATAASGDLAHSSLIENVDYGLFEAIPSLSQSTHNEGSQSQSKHSRVPHLQVMNGAAETTAPTAALAAAPSPNTRRESDKQPAAQENSSIRVGVEKVDQLINLVGELVITQAMIEQHMRTLDPVEHEHLLNSMGQLTRNTRDLQEATMSIRMMPMDYVFSRFPRMVRDLAGKLGKKVEFITHGASTELDKGLIERIIDPLTHLVRNSVDHGIEMPEVRTKSGKHEIGSLTLLAAHRGGNIVIEVSDDGGGLNRERILEKARQSGLEVSDSMPDSEVWQLIFAPGFSTAEKVTDISGRGVGMDVVKRNIMAMNGSVEIKSALGYGTTVSISLPLTLAILDGMSVALGDSIYVIPLNLIVETLQPAAADIKRVAGQGQMVHVRGEYLPVIALNTLFNQSSRYTDPTQGVLVLIEAEGKKAALFVDSLVGQQQVVIKSLETDFRKVQGISGATIMGDGAVALILDIPAIIQIGQSQAQYKEYAA